MKYENKVYGVISKEKIEKGQTFAIGNKNTGEVIVGKIKEILEDRVSKGTFPDESKRPYWAKVIIE